jgi:hypothetical protein
MVRLGIVMFIVMEKKAYLSGYLTTMTVMTLMTVVCRCFLGACTRLEQPPDALGRAAVP